MLANDIGEFFIQKIENIRNECLALNACFDSFEQLSEENVKNLITKSNWKIIQCRLRLSRNVKMFLY